MSAFDPNSNDAILSRILTELKGLRTEVTEHIKECRAEQVTTSERLTALESAKASGLGWVNGAALVVTLLGWAVGIFVLWKHG
jgi:hypothetical protein